MGNYKENLENRIAHLMREYGFREDDLTMGCGAQMKGYVMGLREALTMYGNTEGVSEYVSVDTAEYNGETGSSRAVSTRRTRTSR